MKSLVPWVLFAATGSQMLYASNGIEAYRQGDYSLAAQLLNTQASKEAIEDYYLGKMRLYGYGQLKSNALALRYFNQAADKGVLAAQYLLARYYLTGNNPEKALFWFKKAAAQGDVKAQMYCAAAYLFGFGTPKNSDQAQRFYLDAAKKGNPIAQYTLGEQFLTARPWKTKKAGFVWLSKSAALGNPKAQLRLGELYAAGTLTKRDMNRAQQLMQQAAQQNYTPAVSALAELANGKIPAKSFEKKSSKTKTQIEVQPQVAPAVQAALWLSDNKSANFSSDYQLGGIYTAWNNPFALRETIYNQAPQMEEPQRTALYKPNFKMVRPDEIAINDYFDLVARTLSNEQQQSWGFPHYPFDKRIEVLQNDQSLAQEERLKHYQTVLSQLYDRAILGDSDAQFELGQLYQYGIGVDKNIDQAIVYYQLAADQQEVRAEYNLAILYLEGETSQIDYQTGLSWLTDAAFKGNRYAQYSLAHLYEKGFTGTEGSLVIQPDQEQAMSMYHLAAANHYGPAEYRLADFLVKYGKTGLSVNDKQNRIMLLKRMYKSAAKQGITAAMLPLAFYNAMDKDPRKQAQALQVAKQQAGAGNPNAALLLGMMYDRGIGEPANQANALYWYQQAGLSPVNAFVLGTYYSLGIGLSKDVERGRALLQQASDAGFSYADYNLAILKQQAGENFLPELEKARQLGNSAAGLLLADYYLTQTDNPDNLQAAKNIYQDFAEQGDRDGQLKLAYLYDQGLGMPVDKALAAKWYTLSAEQGQPVAQYLLGKIYQLGYLGKQPNYEEAKRLYQLAQNAYPPAAIALGFVYETIDEDYARAFTSYQLAAKKGNAVGQYDLGLMYENGKGIAVNYEDARKLYTDAAKEGNSKAMTQLADLYFTGLGGDRNESESLAWYTKAASSGEASAMYQLGLFSETGVATRLDFTQAVNYYQQAAARGNEKAKLALARMYQYALGVPKDLAQATRLYTELAANKNAYAQYQLALHLERSNDQKGYGKQLLQQASANGSMQAQKMLQWMDAQQQERISFIEPIIIKQTPFLAGQPANLMYFDALNEWNRGDEILSKMILDKLLSQFPQFAPAKRAYEQLTQPTNLVFTG